MAANMDKHSVHDAIFIQCGLVPEEVQQEAKLDIIIMHSLHV